MSVDNQRSSRRLYPEGCLLTTYGPLSYTNSLELMHFSCILPFLISCLFLNKDLNTYCVVFLLLVVLPFFSF